MPRRDGTGPQGNGSMSGRMMGICKTSNDDVDFIPGSGKRMGMRAGMKSGFGCKKCSERYGAGRQLDDSSRKEMLSREKEMLEERLSQIKREIED